MGADILRASHSPEYRVCVARKHSGLHSQTRSGKDYLRFPGTTSDAEKSRCHVRLVGIPATRDHIKAGALVEDGYGGLETYVQMESLGLEELTRLADHVTDDEDIHDFVLTPREAPLFDNDLDEAIKAVRFQRKMTSILTEFVPDQLSQRVFGTVSLLRKVTAENIMSKRQLAGADPVTQDISNDLIEIERLKKEVTYVREAYQKYIQKIEEDHEYHAGRHRADLQDFLDENQVNIHGLHERVTDLQKQLQSEVVQQGVSERPALDVDILMNFLNANAQLNLQWPRLKALLEHHRDNLPVPSSWKTFSVMAADDPTIPTTAYVPVPLQTRMTKNIRIRVVRRKPTHVAATWTSAQVLVTVLPKVLVNGNVNLRVQRKLTRDCRRMFLRKSRNILSRWIRESNDKCRLDGDLLLRRVDTVGDLLEPYPVVWDQLRLDLQALIRYDINYEDALGWLGDDQEDLDGNMCHDDLTDQNWTLEGDDHDDYEVDDDIVDRSPPKASRAGAKRRRIAPLEQKNRSKREYQQATCTALALKGNLTPTEMMIIEVPANDKVRSWVHYGVRMKWCEKSLHSPFGQTPGFPAFAMTPEAQSGLDDWVEHIAGITRHHWEMLHWVIFLSTLLPESAVMAEGRRNKRYEALVKKKTGVWDIPNRIYHWIIMDKSQLDPATEQFLRLDTVEPARLQWTNLATDKEQIARLPKKVRKGLLPEAEHAGLPDEVSIPLITTQAMKNEPEIHYEASGPITTMNIPRR
ncbi:hypothetical protein PHMEG_0002583 [Phytophthora megakarya]|uniref:Uncharacterized protein n=1 Tax=Phytophthora megakarya TaxID=4795 RepID=A0A225X0B9_9STRA|nr:hypothetical protein PHMEG_0002583 [Phytophthora megakarya]